MRLYTSMNDSIRTVFFDNNLARGLLKGNFGAERHLLSKELQKLITPPFFTKTTPFSLMELLGINAQKLKVAKYFVPSFDPTTDSSESAFLYYKNQYDNLPELRLEFLKDAKARQEQYINPHYTDLWSSLLADCVIKNSAEWIRTALTINAMQMHDLLNDVDYLNKLVFDIIVSEERIIRNCSKMRLAYHFWRRFYDQFKKENRGPEHQLKADKIHGSIRLKTDADCVDCDLIHLAVVGLENSVGERLPVICATNDPPETIIKRIEIYKGFIAYVRGIYKDALPHEYELSHNGKVHCFNGKNGELIQAIDVKNDALAFDFLK